MVLRQQSWSRSYGCWHKPSGEVTRRQVFVAASRCRRATTPILAVHPTVQNGSAWFAVWHHTVAPGFPLPTVPVAVRGAMHLKLDLEATYAEACTASRIP